MAISFKCPECNAVLKSPTAIPAGKQVKCPKCAKPFVVPAATEETAVQATPSAPPPSKPAARPAAPKPAPEPALEPTTDYEPVNDDYEAVDDYEPVEEEAPAKPAAKKKAAEPEEPAEEEEVKPRKKKARAAAEEEEDEPAEEDDEDDRPFSKKKKKSSRHPAALVYSLMILGFGLVALSFAGTLYYILADIKTSGNDAFAYMPANTNVVAGLNFDAIWKLKSGAEAKQALAAQPFVDLQALGLKPDEFLHELVGGLHAVPGGAPGGPKGVLVLKTKVAFDPAKLPAALKMLQKKELNGKEIFAFPLLPDFFVFAPSDRLIVASFGTKESELGDVMKGKGSVPYDLRTLAGKVDRNAMWMAMAFDEKMRRDFSKEAGGLSSGLQTSLSGATGMAFSVNIGTTAKISMGVLVANAAQVAKDAEAAWNSPDTQNQLTKILVGQPPEAKAAIGEIMQNLKFTSDGNLALATTEIKIDTLEKMGQDAKLPFPPPRPGR